MSDIDCILANVSGHDKTATRGPWDHNGRGTVWQVDGYAACDPNAPDSRVAQANDADAALIAYYRTAAPLLAAEVERLRAEVAVLRAESKQYHSALKRIALNLESEPALVAKCAVNDAVDYVAEEVKEAREKAIKDCANHIREVAGRTGDWTTRTTLWDLGSNMADALAAKGAER